jgi:prepilin-type N-terminal cleavage/methylation domain-containing protein
MRNLAVAQSGYTLIEILIAMVILSVTSMAVFTLISIVNTRSTYLLALETRDTIQMEIMRTLADDKAITKTRSKDPIFNNCFRLAKPDRGCTGQTEVGIALYSPSGNRIAGPPSAPAFYTMSGMPCSPQGSTNRCPIQVTTTVRAQALPKWQNNQLEATGDFFFELVEVRYTVKILDHPLVPPNQRLLSGSYVIDTQDQMSSAPSDAL